MGVSVLWALGLIASSALAQAPAITTPPVEQTVFIGDPVTFEVTATGTAPLSYQWFRDGGAVGDETNSTFVFTTSAEDDGDLFSVQVTNDLGSVTSTPVVLSIDFGMPGASHTNRVLEITNSWRYEVSATNLGTAWRETGYADGAWPAGGGLLYVESSALPAPKTTALPLTPRSLPRTCYFRTWFTNGMTNAHSVSLSASPVVDDGIVLYLNGTEVLRDRIAAGEVTYDTFASNVGDAAYRGPFTLDTATLVVGTNLLAAEVHQSSVTSSDIVMGLTLDMVWQERARDTAAPVIAALTPEAGSIVNALTQIEVVFDEGVLGVDAADLLIDGVAATSVSTNSESDYVFQFAAPDAGVVDVTWAAGHGIVDRSADAHAFVGAGFSYLYIPSTGSDELAFSRVSQSSDNTASSTADKAVDGSVSTFSLTEDLPGSYWMAELPRPYAVDQIALVNRAAPDDPEMDGLTLSLFNMDDQVVYETVLSNPGSGGIAEISLPDGTLARSLRIGLSGSATNGAGNHRVGLAEVYLFGSSHIPFMPESESDEIPFTVYQSTDHSAAYPAGNAVDGDTGTFSHTDNATLNNYWIADLVTERPIERVELVDRGLSGASDRLDGLTLRILDENSNSVASVVTSDPGVGGTYTFTPPGGTSGRFVRVGLENGATNGDGNLIIQLAEVRALSGSTNWLVRSSPLAATNNLASFKRSYILRLNDSVAPASNANDDDLGTETKTTSKTVDAYWEVDLGETFALYGVRAFAASGIGYRLENTICRLFDENHDSIYEQQLSGEPDVFDVDLYGPVYARYVRIGLEDKVHSTGPSGPREWWIGFSEVEVFGRPAAEVGVGSFTVSTNQVSAGESVTLDWSVTDVQRAEIYPSIGSVGGHTGTNGIGSLSTPVTNSTEFILVATNRAGVFARAVGVQVGSTPLPVVISEVVADNKHSLEDGYGDAPDWIELRNTGNSTVDLTGWGLSDNASSPMKWVFPTTNMPPHSTLIVFASKNDTSVDPAGHLHADFKLDSDGEPVILTASDGVTTVDSLAGFPELGEDLAYGRGLDGNWTFMEPTPDAVNSGDTYAGWLKSLDWSHARGFHETNFTLTITSKNPAATILYSLDGSVPSTPYTNGLSIDATQSVRVQSAREGYKRARVQTKTFIFLDDVIASPNMRTSITEDPEYGPRVKPGLLALPSLSIVVPQAPNYDEQEASLEVLWPNGESSPIQENCGISRFGGAYSHFNKQSFSLAFRRKYGAGKLSTPLFNGFDRGVLAKTSFDRLQLRAGNHDMNSRGFYMSDRFIQDSYLDMGSLNPHGRYIHLYMNGVYWGMYNCKEVLMESFLADYLGGTEDDYVSVKGNDNIGGGFVVGVGDPPNPEPWERVRSLRTSYEAVRPYLDVSHYIDFMLLWGYGNSESEFRGCGPKEAGSGYKFWINDPDGFLRDTSNNRITSHNGPGSIWSGLRGEGHVDFMMLLADRIYKNFFNNGAMTPARCDARLVARMDEIRDGFLAEAARWNYLTPANWESKSETIRNDMFPHRTGELITHWRNAGWIPSVDPPTFNQYGGAVPENFQPELTNATGTIYYTLDGTDPRLPGGSISGDALIWAAGAVTITNDLTITTRVRAPDGTWSALADPRFLLGSRQTPVPGDLLVTEVNYNPDGPDDYEFIEIWNSGTNLIDMSGVNVSNAVRYIFPEYAMLNPGSHVVVVEDVVAFSNRYQDAASPWYWDGISVSGEWIGGLGDGGETISLGASNGTPVTAVSYRSDGDWPERPNGDGSSLTLRYPGSVPSEAAAQSAYLADGRNWTASSLYHGSPGRFESPGMEVVINEVLSHTDVGVDWVELHNQGGSQANLSGLALTDDMAWPDRYVFSTGTTVDAEAFLTVSASTLGYGFSELGADAALLELSGTSVVRIIDWVEMPAAQREEPFGRYERSDGQVDFTELSAKTSGASNALPRVGPVVISEIMYAPVAGRSAYLEIMNISDAAVPLYDALIPTNTWGFAGVGDFAFPEGTVLAAGDTAILCATNPAAFRAQYQPDSSIPVFGPWIGGLASGGEKLKLLSPGDPEFDGTVPLYRADHVSYRTNETWAAAYQGGISLERRPLESYGNDPASWRASPVGGTPGFVVGETFDMGASVSSPTGQAPRISFSAIEGESYEVHYSDSLNPPDWQLLSSFSNVTTNWIEAIDGDTSVTSRFYRIIWNY